MRKLAGLLFVSLFFLVLLSSCRPPDLEGAYVDFNAGRIDQALVNAEKAVQKNPTNAEAWYLLGEIYGKKDRYQEMVKAWDKSLEISTQFADKINKEKKYYASRLRYDGITKYNAYIKSEDRESDKAKKLLRASIKALQSSKIIENDFKSTTVLAVSYDFLGKPDSALVYYKELTVLRPDTAASWATLGNYYFNQKDYASAVQNFKKALEIDPKNIEAATLIAQSYDILKEYDKAINAYQKAMVLNPKEKAFPYNLGLIYYKMATKDGIDPKLQKEYYQKTAETFGKALEIDPDMLIPYQMKSLAEINNENYEEALKTLKASIEHFPEEGSLWYNLGVVYTHLGNKKEAKAAFKKAETLGYK